VGGHGSAEVLDWMLMLGCRQLRSVLTDYADYDNRHRPHRALGRRHRWGPANHLPSCRLGSSCDEIGSVG
jgi:hypothetical protein